MKRVTSAGREDSILNEYVGLYCFLFFVVVLFCNHFQDDARKRVDLYHRETQKIVVPPGQSDQYIRENHSTGPGVHLGINRTFVLVCCLFYP